MSKPQKPPAHTGRRGLSVTFARLPLEDALRGALAVNPKNAPTRKKAKPRKK